MRRTPRHRHAKQWHKPPKENVHKCCQCIGEVSLAQVENSCGGEQQANLARMSKQPLTHPMSSCSSKRMHDVRGRHAFLTIATTPSNIFAHARALFNLPVIGSSREILCTCDAPALHGRAAVIDTVLPACKCMAGTPGLGLPGLRSSKFPIGDGEQSGI